MTTVVALDPGKHGGFIKLVNGELVAMIPYDGSTPSEILRGLSGTNITHLVMETVHAIAGQSPTVCFSFGRHTGRAEVVLGLVNPTRLIQTVSPVKWQKWLGVTPGLPTTERKRWVRNTVYERLGVKVPLWASDAVALGLYYYEQLKSKG